MYAYYSLEASRDSSVIDPMCDLRNKCPQTTTDLHTQVPALRNV